MGCRQCCIIVCCLWRPGKYAHSDFWSLSDQHFFQKSCVTAWGRFIDFLSKHFFIIVNTGETAYFKNKVFVFSSFYVSQFPFYMLSNATVLEIVRRCKNILYILKCRFLGVSKLMTLISLFSYTDTRIRHKNTPLVTLSFTTDSNFTCSIFLSN